MPHTLTSDALNWGEFSDVCFSVRIVHCRIWLSCSSSVLPAPPHVTLTVTFMPHVPSTLHGSLPLHDLSQPTVFGGSQSSTAVSVKPSPQVLRTQPSLPFFFRQMRRGLVAQTSPSIFGVPGVHWRLSGVP